MRGRSDGSSSGTFPIESFASAGGIASGDGGAGFFPLVPRGRSGDRFFFSISSELWATDGTTAGTLRVPEGSPLLLSSGAVKMSTSPPTASASRPICAACGIRG